MTHTDQQHTAHADEAALVRQAADGDTAAFEELCRRHATAAWDLAHAVTLRAGDAGAALEQGVGTTFTAHRAGRVDADAGFRTLLLTHTHQAAMDRVRARTDDSPRLRAGTDPHLATAFSDLPGRWRGPLWLHVVEDLDDTAVATVTGLGRDDITGLLSRARSGLVERYLHTPAVGAPARNCRRAVSRLGRHLTGSLPSGDRQKLDRHLSLCDACTAMHARLSALGAALPSLAVPAPDDVHARMRSAWTAAVATGSGGSAMSERAEKVLAGVSAFAAAVGVLGAALYAVQDDADPERTASAPIAPLVERVATPRPFDLSGGVALPAADQRDAGADTTSGAAETAAATTTPEPVPSAPRTDPPIAATGPEQPTSPIPVAPSDDEGDPVEQLTDEAPVPDGLVPDADISLEVADQPVEVDVDDDPNLTVGPVSTGSDDTSDEDTSEETSGDTSEDADADADAEDDEPVEVGGSLEPTQPVVDEVNDTVTTIEDSTTTEDSLGL